jgi:hypothetical protein
MKIKYYEKLIGERIYLSPVSVEDAEKYRVILAIILKDYPKDKKMPTFS